MENAPITFTFAGLPDSYCFTSYNRFAQDLVAGMDGFVPGQYNFFNYGSDEPAAEDRNKPWIRNFGDGSPDKTYIFFGGKWVARNPRAAATAERMWWTGTEGDLWSHDGGDGTDPSTNVPTSTTGAMWVRDTDYNARFPLQAGTLPSGTVLNPGDNGGSERTVMPEHTHVFGRMEGSGNMDSVLFTTGASSSNAAAQAFDDGAVGATSSLDSVTGNYLVTTGMTANEGKVTDADKVGFTNLPPYRIGMWAKRSGRIYYVPV